MFFIISCNIDKVKYCDTLTLKINEQEFDGVVVRKQESHGASFEIQENNGGQLMIYKLDGELQDVLRIGDSIRKIKESNHVLIKRETDWQEFRYLYIPSFCKSAR